ncbi:MAG: hypothetical protein AB1512_08100 [Thermodesulfobacteriota bacterium]
MKTAIFRIGLAAFTVLFVTATVRLPAFAEYHAISTDKITYVHGEKIFVNYKNAPGVKGDWISIAPAGSPDDEAGTYLYIRSSFSKGVLWFDTPPPGKYEARAYYNYKSKGYKVHDRCRFSVVDSLAQLEATAAAGKGLGEWVYVQSVIDGETFMTAGWTVVRIKMRPSAKGEEAGGKPAKELTKFFLELNYVWLEGGWTDEYGRRVGRVKLPGGISYTDVVRSHRYDEMSQKICARSGPYCYSPYSITHKPHVPRPTGKSYSDSSGCIGGAFSSDGTWVSAHR